MVRNQVVIDLQRRRQQREMDAIYRCIRRAVDVPDHLLEAVYGIEAQWEHDDYDDTRTAHKLRTATGLRWPAPGLAQRTIRQIRRGR